MVTMMPKHGTDQADVRRGRTDVRQQLEVVFEAVDLARTGRAHRALRAFKLHARVHALALAQAAEFAEAGFEDGFQAADRAAALGGAGIQLGQFRAGPEALLEALGFLLRACDHAALAEDDHPRNDRGDDQQRHDQLHGQAGVEHQLQQVEVAVRDGRAGRVRQCVGLRGRVFGQGFDGRLHRHESCGGHASFSTRAFNSSYNGCGMGVGRKSVPSAATRTVAVSSRSPPRRISWLKITLARRHSCSAAVTSSASSSLAGLRKSICIARTANSRP
jgi:hypothetical protein